MNLLLLLRLKQEKIYCGQNTAPASKTKQHCCRHSSFQDKRKQMISVKDSFKMEDYVYYASDNVRKKKRKSKARSSVRC